MFKADLRPSVIRKPMEKAVIGQKETASATVGVKAPFLQSRLVGSM